MKYDRDAGQVVLCAEELCALSLRRGYPSDLAEKRRADVDAVPTAARLFSGERELLLDLSAVIPFGDATFRISGRADIYGRGQDGPCIGFAHLVAPRDIDRVTSEEYTAYVKCCALLCCLREASDSIRVCIWNVSFENGAVCAKEQTYTRDALDAFVKNLLTRIRSRVALLIGHETRIRPSAADVIFPYDEVREGQDMLMRRGYKAIRGGKRLFAQAPTGIGKTISTLYPAVRAFGKGLCDKIFYLTAKSSTAREAYHAAGKLYAAGAHLRTVILSAKEQMCCGGRGCAGKNCNPHDCAFLRGYYDRVDGAIDELVSQQNGYYADVIMKVAAKHGICAYELSLDLSEICDIIICDYNYLFDPMVYLRRYFTSPGDFGRYVFLIDEAHNLVDRARAMYSVSLKKSDLEDFVNQIPEDEADLISLVEPARAAFGDLRTLCRDTLHTDSAGREVGYYISRNRVESFCQSMNMLAEDMNQWLHTHKASDLYEVVDAYYADIRKYACILDYYDDKFMTYVEIEDEEATLSLTCIDPSEVLDTCMSRARASILFSATLTPTSYFSDVLGGGRHADCIELPSPYDPENLCLAAVDTISTRYEDRDGNCKRIATLIAAAVSPKAGNYIVYFPSYGYLEKVHEVFVKKYPRVRTIVQSRGMTRAQREQFIESFREDEGKMRIGFCVLGGSFSEGVDLPGSRLIGTVIVGVGLPGFSSERNIMRDHFEIKYENGFDYAYTYPGMNSVMQAAGRVIRRETDRGIVVLIDDRYGTPTYQKLFPTHWKHLKYAGNSASLAEIARKFWEKQKN